MRATGLLERAETLTDSVILADRILRAGLFMHASDIHFDAMAGYLRVRFRIDGELEEVLRVPTSMQSQLTSRLKIMAGLDIAEKRAPQDGAFSWRMTGGMSAANNEPLDVRIATLPCRHGERVTLRLLETGGRKLTIDSLGLSQEGREAFDRVLKRPHGLVLLTGPTGSGKTTTLYAAINELLKGEAKNIITVEDPIEYEIPGVAQAEIDSADKVNFAKALKSLLRHDPDVVMIGEIRDLSSLDAAVKAALTGHLVLSTLHTNDAKSTVTRLVDMGLEEHLVGATLRLAVAQRLVKKLCPECREEYAPSEAERKLAHLEEGQTLYRARGCASCAGRGYSGRTGVFEFFDPAHPSSSTLLDDALEKARNGVTSLEEAMKLF